MKGLVPVKRAVDYDVKVRVKMSMNPFDEIAVEETVSLSRPWCLPVSAH